MLRVSSRIASMIITCFSGGCKARCHNEVVDYAECALLASVESHRRRWSGRLLPPDGDFDFRSRPKGHAGVQ